MRATLILLSICAAFIFIGYQFAETRAFFLLPFGIVGGILVLVIGSKNTAEASRRAGLLAKYGDSQIVTKILSRTVWVGETAEQLRDSLGQPPDIDEKVLKTKRKEIWKYAHKGGNRYGLRITVENGVVVGWEERL